MLSCLVMSDRLWPHGLQHARPPCPSSSAKVCPSSCLLHRWCHPGISSSDVLSFYPQSFPASGIFPVNQLFTWDDQNTGVSTSSSILSRSIQGWFPLWLTSLISVLSKGLSGVFSRTTVRRHQFYSAPPSLRSTSHNHISTSGKTIALTIPSILTILSSFIQREIRFIFFS